MQKRLSISQLSARLGLSAHTLRYYERIGLLGPVARSDNGHRVFTEKDLRWVEFLLRLKTTGMSIQQMQWYAELRRRGDATLSARRELLEEHRRSVALRIEALSRSMTALDEKVDLYRQLEADQSASAITKRNIHGSPDPPSFR